MGKELILVATALSNEKGVDKDTVLLAIQSALESATKKKYGEDIGVRVALDEHTGDYETFRYWDIVDDLDFTSALVETPLTQAKEKDPNAVAGGTIEEPMESVAFGRISAQAAKQVIFQKVREAERKLIVDEYSTRIDEIITGVVKRVGRESLILDLGGVTEAILYRSEMLQQDIFRLGDRVRVVLYQVESLEKGPQLFVSRTKPAMLVELFKIEVPEIGEHVIEIKAAAREAGFRAKLAVKTNDGRIDPIGACVGMRGARVQAVSGELGGERIDIILWDDEPAQLVINAMAPAEVASIVIDEEKHSMDLAISEDQLSQAIGKNGQNVRLASELTGWALNVMSEADFQQKSADEADNAVKLLVDKLDVDEDVAALLANQSISSVEEVAYMPEEELLKIDGFDSEVVAELRDRASNALLSSALANDNIPKDDLLSLPGMTVEVAKKLAENEITSLHDLADQAIDDVLDIIPELERDAVGEMIMVAREKSF